MNIIMSIMDFTLASFWHFIGVYLAGYLILAVILVIGVIRDGEDLDSEKVATLAAMSWFGIIAFGLEFSWTRFTKVGAKLIQGLDLAIRKLFKV